MGNFRFSSYKKVENFKNKEKLYMCDANFFWNFLACGNSLWKSRGA